MKILNLIDTPANGGILVSGARNTTNKRFPTPVVKSVSLFQASMPGVAGNKTPVSGNTCWPTCYGFSSYPVLFSYPERMRKASALLISALEKRSNKKGTKVFLSPVFGVPLAYPRKISPSNLDIVSGCRANLCVGAENTIKATVSDSRHKVGFLVFGFMPGVAGNKTPSPGKYPLAVSLYGFFSYPVLSLYPERMKNALADIFTALKKRSKAKGTEVFSAHVLGAYFTHPFNRVSVGSPSIQEVAA